MKILVVLITVLAFCTNCTEESPTSRSDRVQKANSKETPLPQNKAAVQEQNEKYLSAPSDSEAITVYIDPETGEFIPPPEEKVPAEKRMAPPAAFSTPQEGLVEVPSPVPGGGTMVDLKGHFRSPLTATKDSDGKIKIEHQTNDKKE